MEMTVGKDKKTISELLDTLCSKDLRGPFLKALAESVGSSPSGTQKYFAKHGHLPAPTVSDLTKLMLTSPEISKAVEMYPAVVASAASTINPTSTATTAIPSMILPNTFGAKTEVASLLSNPIPNNNDAPKKRKKRNKKKKNSSGTESILTFTTAMTTTGNTDALVPSSSSPLPSSSSGILRPRNFLEAALYFSSITMSTVEMATELEPEHFFAPPLLFVTPPLACEEWQKTLKKANCSLLEWEQLKAQQRRVISLFSVALLQSMNSKIRIGTTHERALGNISVRSNYLKRTIGLYAISLVDHLPPTLTTLSPHTNMNMGKFSSSTVPPTAPSSSILSHFVPQGGASPILLANRKVDLNDLKVPSALQLNLFWESLPLEEKIAILQGEMNNLQKGWINLRKAWCLCKYCRTRTLRLVDVYELFYRAYYDDLEKMVIQLTTNDFDNLSTLESFTTTKGKGKAKAKTGMTNGGGVTTTTTNGSANLVNTNPPSSSPSPSSLRPKTRRLLYRQLSELADDIIDERGYHYQMVMKRLGKAFEEDYDWGDECEEHGQEACEDCQHDNTDARSLPTPNKASLNDENYKDNSSHIEAKRRAQPAQSHHQHHPDYSDEDERDFDDDDDFSDDWDDAEFEIFYEDFNLMEDEEIIQTENDLPLDPAHLSTSFPHLYDPRLYTMPRPTIPAYHHHNSEMERATDGQSLYELFASLLFQFHLVPRYLEAEALDRQQRLLAEEEELERREKERVEQKQKAKQRKKERQKAKRSAAATTKVETENLIEEMNELEEEEEPKVEKQIETEAEMLIPDTAIVKEIINIKSLDMTNSLDLTMKSSTLESSLVPLVNPIEEQVSIHDEEVDEIPPGLLTTSSIPCHHLPSSYSLESTASKHLDASPQTWFDSILTGHVHFNHSSYCSSTTTTTTTTTANTNTKSFWHPIALRQAHLTPDYSP